jgi:hypothetical protein
MPLFGPPNVEKLKKRRDVEGLIQALEYKDENVRRAAADALGEIGGAEAIPVLIQAMGDVAEVRKAAITALGKCGDTQAVEPLTQMLDDKHLDVRVAAVNALRVIGDAQAVEPLIQMLDDEPLEARVAAVNALRVIGDAQAVEPLIQMLDDEPLEVRVAAINALGAIGDAQAVKPLAKALRDSEPDVFNAAATALVGGLGWRLDKRRVNRLIGDISSSSTAPRAVALLRTFGKLTDGSLQGARLERAHLEKMDLSRANLEQANLREADLTGANLAGANLQMADLKEANLLSADLRGANLKGANLEKARLEAKLSPGPMRVPEHFYPEMARAIHDLERTTQFMEMMFRTNFDEKTILPNGRNWSPRTAMEQFTDPRLDYFWRSDDPASPARRVQEEPPTPDIDLDPLYGGNVDELMDKVLSLDLKGVKKIWVAINDILRDPMYPGEIDPDSMFMVTRLNAARLRVHILQRRKDLIPYLPGDTSL